MTLLHDRAASTASTHPEAEADGRLQARPSFRADIQGLRAVAIVLVVLDHVLGWPAGGFIGVDVFFVISGYLITGLLLKEHTRTGRISFVAFYRRRVRRILPAAFVALSATVIAAWFLTPGAAFRQIVLDAASGALSFANWRFAATGTDYFAQTGATSPLQHFWSLAVEEQFYFVWPGLLLVLLALTSSHRLLVRRGVRGVFIGLLVASFVFACWQTVQSPTVAYFSTFTRGWELGVGALLALVGRRLGEALPRGGALLSWGGILMILAAVLIVRPSGAFPGPLALLPVVGAAMVIAGGTPSGVRAPALLTNRAAVLIGAISYSWYLWHFPVLMFLERLAVPGRRRDVTAIVLGLVLAWLSYRFIERPFLGHRTAHPGPGPSSALPFRKTLVMRPAARSLLGAAGVLLVAAASVGVVAPAVEARAVGTAGPGAAAPAVHAVQAAGTPAAVLERDLMSALSARSWPALAPSASEIAQLGSPVAYDAECGATVVRDARSCSFGAATSRSIVVFGDSLGITLLPTVVEAYGHTYRVRGLTLAGCAVADVDVAFGDAAGRQKCLTMRADAIAAVQRTRPVLVLMIENSNWINNLSSGATGAAAAQEWSEGVQRSVDALGKGATRVAVVSPSPDNGTGIAECATPGSIPAACVTRPPAAWFLAQDAESRVVRATYLDTEHWFCVQSVCPAFSGTTPIKRDFVHPTVQYAHELVADFRAMTAPLLGAA